jgi:hypothetical protein
MQPMRRLRSWHVTARASGEQPGAPCACRNQAWSRAGSLLHTCGFPARRFSFLPSARLAASLRSGRAFPIYTLP